MPTKADNRVLVSVSRSSSLDCTAKTSQTWRSALQKGALTSSRAKATLAGVNYEFLPLVLCHPDPAKREKDLLVVYSGG